MRALQPKSVNKFIEPTVPDELWYEPTLCATYRNRFDSRRDLVFLALSIGINWPDYKYADCCVMVMKHINKTGML